ncbi:MAG: hypothetical protein JWN13_6059 [Betaproteobacteria bacterium]|jgi:hypothetical protein|nr:hypothetical protein [Betaproteobacteria bacterium]
MAAATKKAPLRAKARARDKADSVEQTEASVLVMVAAAAKALRPKDIDVLIHCLDRAVSLYEQHPKHAQHEGSQLRAVLTFIRSARGIAGALGRRDDDLRRLEARAEALGRSPIH